MDGAPAQVSPQASRPVRRYHFHTPGLLYIGVTLFLAVGAINSQNNLLFSALGLAIGGLLISGIISGASLMGIRLERLPTPPGAVGSPLTLRYAITNTNRLFPAFGLHIVELSGATGGEPPSWPRFFQQPRTFVVHAGPRQTVQARSTAAPRRRGQLRLGAVQIWSTFPFGLAKKSVTFYLPQTTAVYPPQLPLRRGTIAHLIARADQGFSGQRDPGPGDEFYGLREYQPGDNPRRIAWKRSARTGELVSRIHAAPTPRRLWIVLDLASGGQPDQRHTAQERAIALGAAALREAAAQSVAVGLAIPVARLLLPPREGRQHLDRLLSQLAMLDADTAADAPGSTTPAALRSGACLVIHAGDAGDHAGPPLARHISSSQIEGHIEPSAATAAILALLGNPDALVSPASPASPERAA